MQTSQRPRWLVALLLGLLALGWAGHGPVPVLAQQIGQPAGTAIHLPLQWNGPDTIPAAELATAAPPLQAVAVQGDFQIQHIPDPDGDILRVLPGPAPQAGTERSVFLAWPLPDPDAGFDVPAGRAITLTVSARLFSPPEGARLTIREQGEAWSSSSVTMDGIQWTTYTVRRAIGDGAAAVQMGIVWRPTLDNAWLELRNLQVEIGPPALTVPLELLSPTDTPTPPATPTPTATAAPTEPPTQEEAPTPTLLVVTSTPTPADVFEAATRVAQATEWARILGTATPTPPNMVTATFTPTPVIVTNTPTPGNPATATYVALLATAQAVTTGTATPFPPDAVVLVATDTPTPTPRPAQGRPTPTPTPIFVYLEDLRPTPVPTATPPFPEALQGKILFLSDMFGTTRRPNAFVINPDGTGLALLTSRHFYDRAKARDAYSADRRFYAYALREHANGQAGLVQLFYDDALYGSSRHQLTYFGVGTAWAPAWSPVDEVVALVSSESANDEIWLVRRNEWPPRQLTHNEWEWDHSPSFSPDGSQIVFASNRVSGLRQLWIMDADGSNPRQLTFLLPYEAWDPVWVKYTDD